MRILRLSVLLGLAAAVAGGCDQGQYRSLELGQVNPDTAFLGAREVLGRYYYIDEADPMTGRIVSEPKYVSEGIDRFLSSGQSREIAVIRIRREDGDTWADVRVDIQRQEATSYRTMGDMAAQREIPRQTPAEQDAPLTAEQTELWRVAGHNFPMEQQLLQELYDYLHGR